MATVIIARVLKFLLGPRGVGRAIVSMAAWLSIAAIALLSACVSQPLPTAVPGPSPSPTTLPATSIPQGPSPTATRPPVGGSIRVAGVERGTREVTDLPPFLSAALYDSLLSVDPADGSLKPGLAESWTVSEDGLTMTFRLRQGVKWQDGQPLTASDAAWTINTLASPSARVVPATDFGPISRVAVPDAQTVTVEFKQAYCPALTGIGIMKVLPRHVLEGKDLASLKDDELVGSGPLVLKSWIGSTISLVRYADYWQPPPLIQDWTYISYQNQSEALTAARAGQADVIDFGPDSQGVPAQIPGGTLVIYPASRLYSLAMNLQNKTLEDVGLRRAIAAALDKSKLAGETFGSDARVLTGTLLPEHWAAKEGPADPFDPGSARTMLAAAGWADLDGDGMLEKNGNKLRLSLWAEADGQVSETLGYSIADMLRRVGISSTLQLDDRVGLLTRVLMHQYDLAIIPENIPLDPDQHYYWSSAEATKVEGLNISSYSNSLVDDLLLQGQRASRCDPGTRRSTYLELFNILASDIPQVPLFAPPERLFVAASVGGVAPSSFAGTYFNLSDWHIQ